MGKIDFVVAWVDGSSPERKRKRQSYRNDLLAAHPEATENTRFSSFGEIYYCIASILKYAKFANRIWIITDNQKPAHLDQFEQAGLCDAGFIKVIDHRDIFRGYEEFLPTFNSRSIEAMMWRIPGLAENFVYLNDDFFINRPLESDFFFNAGKPVLRGRIWRPKFHRPKDKILRYLKTNSFGVRAALPKNRAAQELAAKLAGVSDRFFGNGHHPAPLRRSTFEKFFYENDDLLRSQIRHRFRNINQFIPVTLANNLEIARYGNSPEKVAGVAYISPLTGPPDQNFTSQVEREQEPYGCIQSLDMLSDSTVSALRDLMSSKLRSYLTGSIP